VAPISGITQKAQDELPFLKTMLSFTQKRVQGNCVLYAGCAVIPGTESQNDQGWKSSSPTPAEAGSPTAGCTGPCPGGS